MVKKSFLKLFFNGKKVSVTKKIKYNLNILSSIFLLYP